MISAIVVSYRSGELARRAIDSLRQHACSEGLDLEVVCVVNSGDEDEASLVRGVSDSVLVASTNLGYGGGLNAGADRARGEILLFSNPDVLFRPGSLSALKQSLGNSSGLVMAGPALFWDESESLRIPPAVRPAPAEFLRRAIARGRPLGRLFSRDLRLGLEQARAVDEGVAVPRRALSGAVLAVYRRTFNAVGPFNEAYQLYYEENDWQERLRALGGRLILAGAARVIHHFNQSARKEPRAAAWFAASEERFLRSYFGEQGERARSRLEATVALSPVLPVKRSLEMSGGGPFAVAVSPAPYFRPFALALLPPGSRRFELPEDVLAGIGGEAWFARAVNLETGSVVDEAQLTAGA